MKLNDMRMGFTVFTCGALLMALEIMGGRLLTPYYGDTVYLWGSVIGIFLLSLSVGYYFGGKLADKRPSAHVLSVIVLLTGISISAIPFIYKPIIGFFDILPQILGPLASVTAIFLVPSVLLGTVSPFAIKLGAKNLRRIGNTSGNLYALGTLGSVIGTFVATFVLILFLPTKSIFLLLSAVSFAVAAVLSKKSVPFAVAGIVALMAISAIAQAPATDSPVAAMIIGQNYTDGISNSESNGTISPMAPSSDEPVDVEVESLYGLVAVRDKGLLRGMYINGGAMSQLNLMNESKTVFGWKYIDCMEIPFILEPGTKDVLAMGLGGGIFQRRFNIKYNASVDNVEINEKVSEMAQRYFNVEQSDTFKIYIDDARAFLGRTDKKYDFIAIDVIHHDPVKGYKIPFHLTTQEFFADVKGHLNPGGIVMMNFVSNPYSAFLQSEYKTLRSVFDSAYAFNCDTTVLMATDTQYDIQRIRTTAPHDGLFDRYINVASGNNSMVLTDEYAPIDTFGELMVGNMPQ